MDGDAALTARPHGTGNLAHSASIKVDVSSPSGGTLKRLPMGRRRARVQQRLVDIDADHDGVISKDELVDFIEDTVHREAQLRYLKWAAALLLVFTIVLLGAIAGLTAGIVIATKDTKSSGGALAANDATSNTLRTATGSYMRVHISNTSSTANSTSGSTRRLMAAGNTAGTAISRRDAAMACQYLSEGVSQFPASVDNGNSGMTEVAPVQVLAENNCAALASGDTSEAASGIITFQGRTVQVMCAAGSTQCELVISQPTSASGRRLQQPKNMFSGDDQQDCFPAAATINRVSHLGGLERVALQDLTIGDMVQVVNEDGSLGVSPVYLFPHFETVGSHTFIAIRTADGSELRLTSRHVLYLVNDAGEHFASRKPVPAADIKPGQHVWLSAGAFGGVAAVKPSRIVSVRRVTDQGLINPFTVHGNVVVDGFAVSVYDDTLGSEAVMHAFCAAGRVLWRRVPWLLRAVHKIRVAQPLSLAIGWFARKGMVRASIQRGVMRQTPLALELALTSRM